MGDFALRFRQYIGWIVGVIGFFLSLLAGFKLVDLYVADQNLKGMIANFYLLGMVSIALAGAAVRQWQTMRKERYANIAPLLHQLMHRVRDVQTYMREKVPPEGASANEYESFLTNSRIIFRDVLDRLNTIFVSLTSTSCRTSIKLTYPNGDTLCFYTFARDCGSDPKCRELDRKRVKDNHDPLNKNRQFARLFSPDEECWHFISNNLAKEKDFSTTSMTAYKPGYGETVEAQGLLARVLNRKWPLPYKSSIACAIRQGRFDHTDDLPKVVVGFLTVDSESRSVFVEKWDVEIMFAVADALFHPLKTLIEAQNRAAEAGLDLST